MKKNSNHILIGISCILMVVCLFNTGCEKETVTVENLEGIYNFTGESQGTLALPDTGFIDVSILKASIEPFVLQCSLLEESTVNSYKRSYNVNLTPGIEGIHGVIISSQNNPLSSENELISGIGSFSFIVDNDTLLVDGFIDTNKGELTVRYNSSKIDTTVLRTIKGIKM